METLRLRTNDLSWREIDDEVIAVDVETSTYLGANKAGALLWRRLGENGATRIELAELLVQPMASKPSGPPRTSTPFSANSPRKACLPTEMRRVDLPTLRAAWWTQRALRRARRTLRRDGLAHARRDRPADPQGSCQQGCPRGPSEETEHVPRARPRFATLARRARHRAGRDYRRQGPCRQLRGPRLGRR